MLKNLQKQIIIDNYLIGTTYKLFVEYPEFKELSKKTVGEALYNELSAYQENIRISTDDSNFHILMEK